MNRFLAPLLLPVLCVASVAAQISKAGRSYLSVTAVPTHADANYHVGETGAVRLLASAGGVGLDNVTVRFEAGMDNCKADTSGTVCFSNGEALVCFGTSRQPGFRYCNLSFKVGEEGVHETVKVGFDPWLIQPATEEPADFDRFWSKTLKQAAKAPMVYELEDEPQYTTDRVEAFRVKLQSYEKGHFIYGYLLKPRDGEKHPVLFNPPGAGVKRIGVSCEYAEAGYIIFSIGINGFPMNVSDGQLAEERRLKTNYETCGLESPDKHYLRKVYASCVRCIDFLVSLPDWDGQNVGVTGGSQGGALTIVTAGLDGRVTFLAAFYPALCNLSGYLKGTTGGWPNFARNGKTLMNRPKTGPGLYDYALTGESVDTETAVNTLSYYDVDFFARRVKAPGFYSFGYNDNTCAPTSTWSAYNQVTAPKQLVVTPSSGHWRFPETQAVCLKWMAGQLK